MKSPDGQEAVILSPSLYAAAEKAGCDMRWYQEIQEIQPVSPFGRDALREIDANLRKHNMGYVGTYEGIRIRKDKR